MSNSDLNKADGCDVFFSFIIVLILLAGFFLFQYIMEPESVPNADYQVEQGRLVKVEKHNALDSAFKSEIDSFHSDFNSSLETVMSETTETYNSK